MTRLVFGSIVVSRVTIRSAVARRLYTLLSGGIPIMTVELLQPVLQLLVQREVIPVAVSTYRLGPGPIASRDSSYYSTTGATTNRVT